VKELGLEVLLWWEEIYKPGVKKSAMQRRKELNWERRGELNQLMVRQAYLGKKLLN
jgi:hypothetical protein